MQHRGAIAKSKIPEKFRLRLQGFLKGAMAEAVGNLKRKLLGRAENIARTVIHDHRMERYVSRLFF